MINTQHIYLLGLIAHIIAAIFSVGYHHCDEYFQIIEFASYKLKITAASELPWEFANQMRSSIQPMLFVGLHKLLNTLSIHDHFNIVFVFRLLHSLLAFFAMVWFSKLTDEQIKNEALKKFYIFLSMLLWCIPYFHARHSSENLSATLFLFALCVFISKDNRNTLLSYSLIGLLSGMSFVVRFQTGFMVAGFSLWLLFIKREKLINLTFYTLSILLAIGIGILIDRSFYGNWTLTAYNYLNLNIIQDKVSGFGKEPWYYFITKTIEQGLPPYSLLLLLSITVYWIKNIKHYITWITFVFVMIHFMVGHKELRFLFPLLNFIPFIFTSFIDDLYDKKFPKLQWLNFIFNPVFIKTFVVINMLVLGVVVLKPADNIYNSLKFYYRNYNTQNTVIYYKSADPYSNSAALSYFKSPFITTRQFYNDSAAAYLKRTDGKKTLYYMEEFIKEDEIVIADKRFKKVYSTWPASMEYVNFNNWLSRSFSSTVFELE